MRALPGNTCVSLEKAHQCAFSRVDDEEEFRPYSNMKECQGQSCTGVPLQREEI